VSEVIVRGERRGKQLLDVDEGIVSQRKMKFTILPWNHLHISRVFFGKLL